MPDTEFKLEHEKRITAVEERSKSNSKRLDKLEPVAEAIYKLHESMIELVAELKHTNETVSEIKEKVEVLEQEPAKRWQNIEDKFIGAFVGAVGTALAGALIYLISINM